MSRSQLYVFSQFGWPDGAATAQLLCQALRSCPADLDVVLVQSTSTYLSVPTLESCPPVTIRRIWGPRALRDSLVRKVVGSVLFYFGAAVFILTKPTDTDVLVMTSPPFLVWLGAVGKRVRGGRLLSWEMDVYPEILFRTGLLQHASLLGRALSATTNWARRQTDLVIVLGPCMADLIVRSESVSRVEILQNWSDGALLRPVRTAGCALPLRLLYSGNLGVAHDIDTLSRSIAYLDDRLFEFVFACKGVKVSTLKALGLSSVKFRDPCSVELLNGVFNEADIGIVTQTEESVGCVVPSKFYGLLAAGRPILYVGPLNTTVAITVGETACGWVVKVGDVDHLVELLNVLASDLSLVVEAGRRAREVFDLRFTQEASCRRFWELVG